MTFFVTISSFSLSYCLFLCFLQRYELLDSIGARVVDDAACRVCRVGDHGAGHVCLCRLVHCVVASQCDRLSAWFGLSSECFLLRLLSCSFWRARVAGVQSTRRERIVLRSFTQRRLLADVHGDCSHDVEEANALAASYRKRMNGSHVVGSPRRVFSTTARQTSKPT